ncbi:hypothetical protein BAUCODRAFT_261298 [Baudoinia panamericana UAMH 10762]|uniref:Uncharacterized protein n=1 Tax=Baudoinia panamericana (strain UAMH 10762) TaxID=717646 RepID=M2LFD9_BAUPA|nr:uncharacterized protein BAUCODRAFT_261298 [Baudoinia panamericana UAMH 10762]EMC92752.1 hypothetical protein BAUCODRAFT_261298 [Baudoinia panamericana UAMH 10762]
MSLQQRRQAQRCVGMPSTNTASTTGCANGELTPTPPQGRTRIRNPVPNTDRWPRRPVGMLQRVHSSFLSSESSLGMERGGQYRGRHTVAEAGSSNRLGLLGDSSPGRSCFEGTDSGGYDSDDEFRLSTDDGTSILAHQEDADGEEIISQNSLHVDVVGVANDKHEKKRQDSARTAESTRRKSSIWSFSQSVPNKLRRLGSHFPIRRISKSAEQDDINPLTEQTVAGIPRSTFLECAREYATIDPSAAMFEGSSNDCTAPDEQYGVSDGLPELFGCMEILARHHQNDVRRREGRAGYGPHGASVARMMFVRSHDGGAG